MPKPVRTRFAPSPTGYLHVGGVRTALFAWLFAQQHNGAFVLRLEDTDRAREVEGADQHIMDSLHALGIDYDEGPDIGGTFGPYRQSERLDSYKTWAQKLIGAGRAYADPYTPEEVQQFREQAQAAKKPFLYRNHRPENPPVWDGTKPLRFLSQPKDYTETDLVMGEINYSEHSVDDFILIKSDGYPTYNFSHIVDDVEMEITHVIRGQEFIASQANYFNLYEALGVTPPQIATLPHILGPDGKKKLSKRDGAKDVLDYIRDGFLPEAMVNFIASLGWNDGTEQEIFSREELIKKFSLERVQRSGAKFDEQRLLWMNGSHIRELSLDELYERLEVKSEKGKVKSFWPPEAQKFDDVYKKRVLALVQERLKFLGELPQLTNFFFTNLPVNLSLIDSNKQLKKFSHQELKELLEKAKASLEQSDFSLDDLTKRLNDLLEQTGQKPGVLFSLIRIATTQAPASPGLADTLEVLGKNTTIQRLQATLQAL